MRGLQKSARRPGTANGGASRSGDGGSYLRQRSIAPVTEQRYHDGMEKLVSFASARNLDLQPGEPLDRALELLANTMFFQGCGVAEFRYVAWGYAWVHCLSLSKNAYPRTHASLRGWKKASPDAPRLPLTWELLLLAIDSMLKWHREQPEVNKLQAACALAIQWDLYLRPSEVLELECADVVDNATKSGTLAVIARAAPDSKEGSKMDLIGARRGSARSKPAKDNEYDGTVLAGGAVSRRAGRSWIASLLRTLRSRPTNSNRLFTLSLSQFERICRATCERMELEPRRFFSPHCARHGGASADAAHYRRSLADIQARGRWAAKSSVARYRKAGTYARQVARLSPLQRREATLLNATLPGRLIREVIVGLRPVPS